MEKLKKWVLSAKPDNKTSLAEPRSSLSLVQPHPSVPARVESLKHPERSLSTYEKSQVVVASQYARTLAQSLTSHINRCLDELGGAPDTRENLTLLRTGLEKQVRQLLQATQDLSIAEQLADQRMVLASLFDSFSTCARLSLQQKKTLLAGFIAGLGGGLMEDERYQLITEQLFQRFATQLADDHRPDFNQQLREVMEFSKLWALMWTRCADQDVVRRNVQKLIHSVARHAPRFVWPQTIVVSYLYGLGGMAVSDATLEQGIVEIFATDNSPHTLAQLLYGWLSGLRTLQEPRWLDSKNFGRTMLLIDQQLEKYAATLSTVHWGAVIAALCWVCETPVAAISDENKNTPPSTLALSQKPGERASVFGARLSDERIKALKTFIARPELAHAQSFMHTVLRFVVGTMHPSQFKPAAGTDHPEGYSPEEWQLLERFLGPRQFAAHRALSELHLPDDVANIIDSYLGRDNVY